MPTPMWVFKRIAAEYGVDANDDVAVDEFFERIVPTFTNSQQSAIFASLINYDAPEPSSRAGASGVRSPNLLG